MVILKKRGWEIPESQATPEHVFMSRRSLIRGAATIAAAAALPGAAWAENDPTAALYPAKKNEKYVLDRAITPEARSSNYNNFYEFGFDKAIASRAQALKLRPWTVKFDGMVEKEKTVGIDDLIAAMPLEERLYRMRCVEAWSMAVPWSGFPMAKLVEFAKPLSGAKYVRMETFLDTSVAPMQKQVWYPWPYVEGVTIEEAMNEMAFMVTGVYGKPLLKQFGAPIRLVLPWKYGFKGIKSIVRMSFVAQRPKSYWEVAQGSEYGFWANVNPAVSHPRWSQATEEDIGIGQRRPTQLFNGYGEYVAGLYKDLQGEKLWM
jgi:methionine sulfoxide reductase catalytic subunit